MAYGHRIETEDDKYLKLATRAISIQNNGGPLGNTPVDWLPMCE